MTTAFPLSWPQGWPRTPANARARGPFQVTFGSARDHLVREVTRLESPTLVISSNAALNRHGLPYHDQADDQIADPGVAVYFQRDGQPMSMAQDRYLTITANLRSIGLAIEHLRGLARHGGGHMMARAFGGFAALPPPAGGGGAAPKPWREILAPIPDGLEPADTLTIAEVRYRTKAKQTHADVAGGSDEQMIVLNAAIEAARRELDP